VDLWVQTTLEGYIIEFLRKSPVILKGRSNYFMREPRGRLLREISLWMKILLVEEGMLLIPLVEMAK
jgi:hypothetical protein